MKLDTWLFVLAITIGLFLGSVLVLRVCGIQQAGEQLDRIEAPG